MGWVAAGIFAVLAIGGYGLVVINVHQGEAALEQGQKFEGDGELDKAIASYTQAIGHQPRESLYYDFRGYALYRKGALDQATADFSRAIELNPQDSSAYEKRGTIFADKGQWDQAIADYSQAIQHADDGLVAAPKPYALRGKAFREKGDWDKAFADFNSMLSANPKSVGAFEQRGGLTFEKKGDRAAAIGDFRNAIELTPADNPKLKTRLEAHLQQLLQSKAVPTP
jgi:tetratricopeptide (TPR) repeat protein